MSRVMHSTLRPTESLASHVEASDSVRPQKRLPSVRRFKPGRTSLPGTFGVFFFF